MKTLVFLPFCPHTTAKRFPHPTWTPGIYGGPSLGYGFFLNPFKKVSVAGASLPATGKAIGYDFGIALRNQFGLRFAFGGLSTNDVGKEALRSLATKYPGHFITYASPVEKKDRVANYFSLGISYSIQRQQRWYIQPEFLIGYTKTYSESGFVQVKESGTHRATVYQLIPHYPNPRSLTLIFGGRAAWFTCGYFGFFADARLLAMWHEVQYQVVKTTLVEQTIEKETVQMKNTTWGALVSIGLFFHISTGDIRQSSE